MKNYFFLLLLLGTSVVFAGKGLVVTQKYSTTVEGQNVTVTWYVTETQCKLKMLFSDKDVNTTNYFIPDVMSSKLLTYSDGAVPAGASKIYYSFPVAEIKGTLEASTIEHTGEIKQIGGMNCEKILAKTGNNFTEMWVTKDFKTDYYRFASFFKNSYELKALSEGRIKGFPLSSVTKDNSGKVINAFQLLSVSSTEISDTEFNVPAEYKSADEVGKAKK